MNLYNPLPFLNGWKSLLAGYGLMLAGLSQFLVAIATITALVGNLLTGEIAVSDFAMQIPALLEEASLFFFGLLGIGLAHKVEKAKK